MSVKVRDVLRRLQDDGWYIDRMRGSHRQLRHPTKPGVVTVPGKPNDDLAAGTWASVQQQAGWRTATRRSGHDEAICCRH